MIVSTSAQTAVRNVRITGHGAWKTLSTFVRQAGDFVGDHPLLLVALAALAVLVFKVTRPRVS